MASPAEAGKADVAVQLDRVKARIDEVHGDLVHTIDALQKLNTEPRQSELQSRATCRQGARKSTRVEFVLQHAGCLSCDRHPTELFWERARLLKTGLSCPKRTFSQCLSGGRSFPLRRKEFSLRDFSSAQRVWPMSAQQYVRQIELSRISVLRMRSSETACRSTLYWLYR